MIRHEVKRWIGDRFSLLILLICAMALGACATAPHGEVSQIDSLYFQPQFGEPAPPPGKSGTKIRGTVGAGPGTMELTDAAGDKAFVHVDKDGNIDGFVDKENFKPVTSTLELNDRSKTTWTMQDGKWRAQTGLSSQTGAGLINTGGGQVAPRSGEPAWLLSNLLGSTEVIVGGGGAIALGGTGGTSDSNFANTSGQGDRLSGGAFNVTIRTLPFNFYHVRMGTFFEFDEFFGVKGTGGQGVHHLNPAVNDTMFTKTANRAFGFGIAQVFPIGGGFCLDLHQGFAVVQQRLEGETNQVSGGGPLERFEKSLTNIVPKFGASIEYQLPHMPFRLRVASEFLYLPDSNLNGFATYSNSPFIFSSQGQWLATNTFSFVFPLAYFQGAR